MQPFLVKLRRLFLGGLLIVVPAILTFIVLRFLFDTVDGITRPIFERIFATYIPGTGLLATLIVILLAGLLSKFFIGRQLYLFWDAIVHKIPLVGMVYGPAKQLMEAFTSEQHATFSDVVIIEYPAKGIYTVGFATRQVALNTSTESVQSLVVFIPTTPTPLSGFTVLMPARDVRRVDLTIEQAMRFVVSGGISCPDAFEITPLSSKTSQSEATSETRPSVA